MRTGTVRFYWMAGVLALALMLTAGCQMVEPPPTPSSPEEAAAAVDAAMEELATAYPLAATAWELDFIGPPEEPVALLPDTRATLLLFWERYAGFDGCNWFLGVYTATPEGDFRLMTPLRTTNFCSPEALLDQSLFYTSALLNTIAYTLEDEQLAAYTANDQRLLTFTSARPVPTLGTTWVLKFWWNAEREDWFPVLPFSTTSIEFGQDGEAIGSGGCNNFTVGYEGDLQIEKVMEATDTYAELPTLTFGPVASQMMECAEPEGIMEQEQAFFATLDSVAYYFKLGGMVMMVDAEGEPLLILGARN